MNPVVPGGRILTPHEDEPSEYYIPVSVGVCELIWIAYDFSVDGARDNIAILAKFPESRSRCVGT